MVSSTLIFSKELTKTDVTKRMSIPTNKLTHFPRFQLGCHAVVLKVEDELGQPWSMRCSIRKTIKYRKPVMSTGWITFARCKNLDIGDRVTLYKVVDDEGPSRAKYKIEVQKATKVFGVILGYSTCQATV